MNLLIKNNTVQNRIIRINETPFKSLFILQIKIAYCKMINNYNDVTIITKWR